MKNFDVAIIGFGPVGATAANMFAKSGFNIIVVESKFDIWDIPRAVHFDGQTQRIFQSCLLYTSPSPRDLWISRMPSSA